MSKRNNPLLGTLVLDKWASFSNMTIKQLKEEAGKDSKLMREKRFIIIMVTQKTGEGLQYAHSSLKKEYTFVRNCIRMSYRELKHAPTKFQIDPKIIWEVLKECKNLKELPKTTQDSPELIKALWESTIEEESSLALKLLAQCSYTSFKRAAEKFTKFRGSREFIKFIINKGIGPGLVLANETLRENKGFVLECVRINFAEIEHTLLLNSDIIWAALQHKECQDVVKLPKNIQDYQELIVRTLWDKHKARLARKLLKKRPFGELEKAVDKYPRLGKDEKFIKVIAGYENGEGLVLADDSLKKNRNFVLEIVSICSKELENAPEYQTDIEIIWVALKQCKKIERLPKTTQESAELVVALWENYEEGLALKLFKQCSFESFKTTLEKYRALSVDQNFIISVAMLQKFSALSLADVSLKKDKGFVLKLVSINPKELKFAVEELQLDPEVIWAALLQGKKLDILPKVTQESGELLQLLHNKVLSSDPKESGLAKKLFARHPKRKDMGFLLDMVGKTPKYVALVPNDIAIDQFKLLWLSAIVKAHSLILSLPEKLDTVEFWKELVTTEPSLIVNTTKVEFCIKLVAFEPKCLSYLHSEVKSKGGFWIGLVAENKEFMGKAKENREEAGDELEFYKNLAKNHRELVEFFPTDKPFWINFTAAILITKELEYKSILPEQFRNEQFYLEMVVAHHNCLAAFLKAADSGDFKAGRENFLHSAIDQSPKILNDIPERFDADFVSGVVAKYKDDVRVVRMAVQLVGKSIEKADDSIKKDEYTVLLAVQQNGYVLACEGILIDKDIVAAALKENLYSLSALPKNKQEPYKTEIKAAIKGRKSDGILLYVADEIKKEMDDAEEEKEVEGLKREVHGGGVGFFSSSSSDESEGEEIDLTPKKVVVD